MTRFAAGGGFVAPAGELATVFVTDGPPIGGLPATLGKDVTDADSAGGPIGALDGPLGAWDAGMGTKVIVVGTLMMMPGFLETWSAQIPAKVDRAP